MAKQKKATKAKKVQPKKAKSSRPRVQTVPKRQDPGFADAGQALGAMVGGPIGSVFGRLGGGLISHITGYGDYKVNSNTVYQGNSVPTFANKGDGVEVSHREYIMDLSTATSFIVDSLAINPGLPSTFPWLSGLAAHFEQYEMLGLVFEYRPTSGTILNTTNAAMGVILMATNYDANDPTFSSKQEMEAYEYSSSSSPQSGMLHPVECAPDSRPTNVYYVRTAGLASGANLLDYDIGNFFYAATGAQSAYTAGELWVTYHVRFRKPKLASLSGFARLSEFPRASASAANPFGTTGVQIIESSIPGLVAGATPTNSFALYQPGYYWFQIIRKGGTITSAPDANNGDNMTFAPDYLFNGTAQYNGNYSSTVGTLVGFIRVDAVPNGTPADNTLTLTNCAGQASGTTEVFITYLGPALNF